MGDFNFLNTDKLISNQSVNTEEDNIAMYFKMRQEMCRNSLTSSTRSSALSTLSLNQASFTRSGGCEDRKTLVIEKEDAIVFRKPATPAKKVLKVDSSENENRYSKLLRAELSKADETINRAYSKNNDLSNEHGPVSFAQNQPPQLSDIFVPSFSPQTPRTYLDDLSSILPETSISSVVHPTGSAVQFPHRQEGDILSLLQKDEKKFVANTSGFSHNSDISRFSGRMSQDNRVPETCQDNVQLSFGEFFGKRSDSINSIIKGKDETSSFLEGKEQFDKMDNATTEAGADENKTINTIHHLLRNQELSSSALCEALLKGHTTKENYVLKNTVQNASRVNLDMLTESRQSTPKAARFCTPPYICPDKTPMRKGGNYQPGRFQFDASTPLTRLKSEFFEDAPDANMWQQLRQTRLENDEPSDSGHEVAEQTIGAGNITMISQRIGEMTFTPDITNSCSTGLPPPLLAMVNKLSELPEGTVDWSALTPLIKQEFPHLLDDQGNKTFNGNITSNLSLTNRPSLCSESGSWINYSSEPQTITACVQTKKIVSLPMASKDLWLLMRISAVELIIAGCPIRADRQDETWVAGEFMTLRAKSVVLPPNIEHQLQFSLVCQKPLLAALRLTLVASDMNSPKTQNVTFKLFLSAVLPPHAFSLLPSPSANFGTLPENCYEDCCFRLTYLGDCDVPLLVFIQQDKMPEKMFILINNVSVNGIQRDISLCNEESFEITLLGGQKQSLEFNVRFYPSVVEGIEEKRSINFDAELRVELRTMTNGRVTVARTKLQGAVAFAKFLCRTDCSPVIFNAVSCSAPISKPFYIKNVGAIPLKVALKVTSDPNDSGIKTEVPMFSVPEIVAIPLEESVCFPIEFMPCQGEKYSRRFLVMKLEPNGLTNFDVELIGTVPNLPSQLSSFPCSSRTSVKSGSTAISGLSNGVAVKLTASNSALSWIATPLQKPVLQSLQVKLKCETSASARVSIYPDTGAFKIMNEKSEALSKIRKLLKPEVPVTINVQFKPDSIGLHHTTLSFSFTNSTEPSTIKLIGFGGSPKLKIEDTQLDLHGNRMIKLAHPRVDNYVFCSQFRITNYGNAPGFILINPTANVLSVAQCLKVYPLRAVLEPNTNVIINVSQYLSRGELSEILCRQDIRKLATLNLLMGDETSRLRLRRHIKNEEKSLSDNLKNLTQEFPDECSISLDGIKESKHFEATFLNSLLSNELVVVIEKSCNTGDQTVADMDDTSHTFATISNTILVQPTSSAVNNAPNTSCVSIHSQDSAAQKVQDWLRKVE